MDGLKSGEVAKKGGVNLETIRYYERRGLLPKPPRTPVEIVAWHARGQTGWRYQVQSSDGTMEGWLSAAHLRRAPGVSG